MCTLLGSYKHQTYVFRIKLLLKSLILVIPNISHFPFPAPKSSQASEPLNLRMDTGHSLYRFPFYNSFKNFHQHQPGMPLKKLDIWFNLYFEICNIYVGLGLWRLYKISHIINESIWIFYYKIAITYINI